MPVQMYCAATSVDQLGRLDVHLNDSTGVGVDADLVMTQFGSGTEMRRASGRATAHPRVDPAADREWQVGYTIEDLADWPSGLYSIQASPGSPAGERIQHVAYFAVRAADPGQQSRILVSLPFPTWHAYSWAGDRGASPYWNEQPDRGHRVSP